MHFSVTNYTTIIVNNTITLHLRKVTDFGDAQAIPTQGNTVI